MTQTNMPETVPAKAFDPKGASGYRSHVITPLARAALDNGVPFEDVQAYVESMPWHDPAKRDRIEAAWYEAVNVPEMYAPVGSALQRTTTSMVTDTLLEGALVRSVLASGSLAAARLWWQGVL